MSIVKFLGLETFSDDFMTIAVSVVEVGNEYLSVHGKKNSFK